jgi:hypothetical protein
MVRCYVKIELMCSGIYCAMVEGQGGSIDSNCRKPETDGGEVMKYIKQTEREV